MARPSHRRGAGEDEELDDELDDLPLPDRTRVEASPFYEGDAAPAAKRSPPRRAPEPPPPDDDDEESTSRTGPGLSPPRKVTRFEEAAIDEPELPPEAERTQIGVMPSAPAAPEGEATQAGPPISILVVEGPDAGSKKSIRGGRMIVGRGDGCDLMLSDSSVSRRHLELVAGMTGVVLRDLGSGNGTKVNGNKVAEAQLAHRDRIALGRTVLEVVDALKLLEEKKKPSAPSVPIDAPARPGPRPASRPPARAALARPADDDEVSSTGQVFFADSKTRSKKPLYVAGGALGLLLLIAVVVLVRPKPPPPEPVIDPAEARFDELLQQSRNLLRELKYAEAITVLEEARGLKETSELMRQLEAATRERDSNKLLAAARGLAANYQFEDALAELKKIPETSLAYDEARTLTAEYNTAKFERAAQAVRDAAAERDFERARELLTKVAPLDADALSKELAAAERQAKVDEAREAAEAKRAAASRKRAKLRRAQAEDDDAISGVVKKIDTGNFDGAVRELDRVAEKSRSTLVARKVRSLRKLIPQFGKAYDEGVTRYNAGALEVAAGLLERSLKLYRDMDIDGRLEGSIEQKLSRALLAKGRAAMSRQEYGLAAKTFKQVLRFDPNVREAKSALADITSKAHEVYLEGYVQMQRSPETARKKFQEVMEMVPASDKNHQDAKRRMAQLDAAGP